MLLGQGQMSSSFATMLIAQQRYSKVQYGLQDRTLPRRNMNPGYLPFETLGCFIAIAQEERRSFIPAAARLSRVLQEPGTIGKKLHNFLLIAKGGDLPDFIVDSTKPQPKNHYAEIFKKMFGSAWLPTITLHKLITMPHKDLALAMQRQADPQIPEDPAIGNIRKWAY